MTNQVKTDAELERMRVSGKMLAHVLRYLSTMLHPGMTTKEIDILAAKELDRLGGRPAFLGYGGFPAVICVSVNDEVVHGVPGSRQLAEGDLVGMDFGVNFEGMITDAAVTVPVGEVDADSRRLLHGTKEALDRGMQAVRSGARVGDISHAVENRLVQDGLGVIEELSGHGVGHQLHEDPIILNYGRRGTGMRLKAGMTIAIEPMATLGGKDIQIDRDGWTIRTADGSKACQFENTVLVLENGFEILTQ